MSNWLIKARKRERMVHLVAAVLLFAYVYVPKAAALDELIRLVAFPLLALTGVAMWKAAAIRRALTRVGRRARACTRAP